MAQITPLESSQEEVHENDAFNSACGGSGKGKRGAAGLGTVRSACLTLPQIFSASHDSLLRTAWGRRAVELELRAINFRVEVQEQGRYYFVFTDAGGNPVRMHGPPWSPMGAGGQGRVQLLGWTGKMGCPTFDLPAGPPEVGGACPAARAGQSIMPADTIVRAKREIDKASPWPESVPGAGGGDDQGDLFAARGATELSRIVGTVCQWCLTGDTRVLVFGRGLVRLDEAGDDEFAVWSGQGWQRTQRAFQGVREVVTLETTWGHRLRLTADHKVLTEHGMIEAKDLEPGMALVATLPPASPFAREVPLPTIEPNAHPNARPATLPKFWSSNVGYVLGALLGDGCIYYHEKYPTVSIVGSAKQQETVALTHAVIGSWFDTATSLKVRAPIARAERDVDIIERGDTLTAMWRIGDLVRFLDVLGLDKRPAASERRAPTTIWQASEDGVRGFLRGLFDTDGSVSAGTDKVEVSLASVSHGLLEDVQLLLGAFNIRSSICEYADGRAERGYSRLWKLSVGAIESVRRFADVVNFAVLVKRDKLVAALDSMKGKRGIVRQPRVVSVSEPQPAEPVYDLVNVGPERQFLANGIVVSNCYATRQTYTYSSTQLAEIVAYSWAQQALRMPAGNGSNVFVETMVGAIGNLFHNGGFDLEGGHGRPPEAAFAPDGRGGYARCAQDDPQRVMYFRIHSSGDFFSLEYMAAWAEVCRRFPKVLFWAPVRIWGMPAWQSKIDAMNIPPNMLMRPSAYYTNGFLPDTAEISKKFIAGTTVIRADNNKGAGRDERYDVNCPAYEHNNDAFTCRHSTAPEDGEKHCRTCWISPRVRVNYTLHG